jgi:hypothetical protein
MHSEVGVAGRILFAIARPNPPPTTTTDFQKKKILALAIACPALVVLGKPNLQFILRQESEESVWDQPMLKIQSLKNRTMNQQI